MKKIQTYCVFVVCGMALSLGQAGDGKEEILQLETQVVQSSPLLPGVNEATQSWSVLEGNALDTVRGATLGETLMYLAGVSQSYYGPGASRPVIRGLDGNRVLVLQDGLELMDVSAQSGDHAVAMDPLLVDRVEVLRGSAALLYGSNAIGGVVNVIENSIPNRGMSGRSVVGRVRTGYSSVNDGRHVGAVLTAGSDNFVVRGYGIYRRSGDYHTPRFSIHGEDEHDHDHDHGHDHEHHADAHGHHDDEDEGHATTHDRVRNTYNRVWQAGVGASWILDNGYIGGAFSYYDSHYGVPNEEGSSVKMERKRLEVKGSLAPDGPNWLTDLRFSGAYNDYRHDELEGDGSLGGRFLREGVESRIEALHTFGKLAGALGVQIQYEQFKIRGSESLFSGQETGRVIHKDDKFALGVFLVESYSLSERWTWNGGVRGDFSWNTYRGNVSSDNDAAFSASTGLGYKLGDGWSLTGNLAYSQRAADRFERYADGFHHASGIYEVGNPHLGLEKSLGVEVSLVKEIGSVTGRLTGYYNHFNHFIYLSDSGHSVEIAHAHGDHFHHYDVARYDYRGVKAEFYGLEGELVWRAYENEGYTLDLKAFGDYVYARNLTDHEYLPRTSPWRLGTGVDVGIQDFRVGMNLVYTGQQTQTARGESATPDYVLLNLHASYQLRTRDVDWTLFVKGNNLTNELARVHTSFLKDRAPLPGAGFEIGLTAEF